MKFNLVNDNFDVEFSNLERLLCLRWRLIVPLAKITSAYISGDQAMDGITLRLVGTGPLPGYKPGIFEQYGDRVFFNAHNGQDHLVLETQDYSFARVVLDATEANQEVIKELMALKR